MEYNGCNSIKDQISTSSSGYFSARRMVLGKRKLKTDSIQILILVLVVSVSAITTGYAISTSWTASNTIRVTTSNLGVYADAALTQPVPSSVDWGTYHPGDRIAFYVWIRNQGTNSVSLFWTSDLSANSGPNFSDQWLLSNDGGQTWHDLQGQSLSPSQVLATKYVVQLSTVTPD